MLKPEDFTVGDRVTWSIYGRVFCGTVQKIIQETSRFVCKGDLMVLCDHEPGYPPNHVVPIIPGISVNKLPGTPFPYDSAINDEIAARHSKEIQEYWDANPL